MTTAEMLEVVEPIQGWMSAEELAWLHDQASSRRLIVEFGTWLGRSAKAMALATPGIVFCVDHWRGAAFEMEAYQAWFTTAHGHNTVRQLCKDNLANEIMQKKLLLLEMDISHPHSRGVLQTIFGHVRPDMIFIDGAHDFPAVLSDTKLAASIGDEHTLICGHDYNRREVRDAVYHALVNTPWRLREAPDRLWAAEVCA